LMLVCSSMEVGGAERVLSELANAWANQGHSITLVSTYRFDKQSDFFVLDPRIERIRLARNTGHRKAWTEKWQRLLALRRLMKSRRPDAVVAFMDKIAVITLFGALGLGATVIACERTDPERHVIGRDWSLLRRLAYPWAAAVTVQTAAVKESMSRMIPGLRVRVMPNPIPPLLLRGAAEPGGGNSLRRLVLMGRLSREKGADLAIDAFSLVAARFPQWELWIWGEGPERPRLEEKIAALGLEARVFLPGRTDAPWSELEKADIFVLPSRYEGMPNAMLEAMALGRPVVAFDCGGVPGEITRGGEDAVLVPPENVPAMAAAFERLMLDQGERRRLGNAALSVRDRYSMDRVLRLWDELFEEIA